MYAEPHIAAATDSAIQGSVPTHHNKALILLAACFCLASVIMTAVSVEIIALLRATGWSTAAAIRIGALIGPSQVGARALEMFLGRSLHPLWSLLASTLLVAVGLSLTASGPGLTVMGMVLYGAGSGIRAVVRGTLPLATFGSGAYVTVMARLARPVLIAQAATPLLVGYLLGAKGPGVTLYALCAIAVLNIGLACALIVTVRPGSGSSIGSRRTVRFRNVRRTQCSHHCASPGHVQRRRPPWQASLHRLPDP